MIHGKQIKLNGFYEEAKGLLYGFEIAD